MGKLLELLKDVSLPPDIEAKVRILDLQFDQMEIRIKELEQEYETLRMKEDDETRHFDEPEQQKQVPRYTTQRIAHPNDPTEEEVKALKLLQPAGQFLSAQQVAELLQINLTNAQHYLNELERKDKVRSKHYRRPAYGAGRPTTYYLTDGGIKYLVEHDLTQ
jgi:response regulator of citrate/malate metabolism